MARILALDFIGDWVYAVESSGGRGVAVSASFAGKFPAEFNVENAEANGAWLKEQLASAGFRASDAVCTLGRQTALVKRLTVPDCPENELASIVHFAAEDAWAASDLGQAGVLDFQAGRPLQGEREVLIASLAPEAIELLRKVVTAAGLKMEKLGLRPFSTHFACAGRDRGNQPQGCHALVVSGGDLQEISVWQGESLLLSRSISSAENGEEWAKKSAAEVLRTIAAFRAQSPDAEIERVIVCENGTGRLSARLGEVHHLPVERLELDRSGIEPEKGSIAAFAGALGSAWLESSRAEWPIDWVAPKKPVVVADRAKSRRIMIAAAIALVPLLAAGYGFSLLWAEQARIDALDANLAKLQADQKQERPMLERYKAMKDWADGEIDCLNELEILARMLPDTSELFLESIEIEAGGVNGPANIKLKGLARNDESFFATRLVFQQDADHYDAMPPDYSLVADFPPYFMSFDAELDVHRLASEKYLERTSKPPASAVVAVEEGKERVPISAGKKSTVELQPIRRSSTAASAPTLSSSPRSSPPPRTSTASSRPARSSDRDDDDGDSPADAKDTLIKRLKAMSYEERQAELAKMPKFIRDRTEKMLKESN